MALAVGGFSRLGSLAQTMLARRRPLAPLAVTRPDGTGAAVKPPTQARSPFGTIFSTVQQLGNRVPASNFLSRLRPQAAPAPRPAAPPAPAPAAAQPAAPPAAPAQPAIAPRPAYEGADSTLINSRSNPYGPPGTPPPARPMIQPPAPGQPGQPGQFGADISDITGQERPQAINPGQSVTQPLQERAQQEAMRALENPSPYDDELFKQEVDRARQSFNADIAERGLDYSSIAPQEFSRTVLNPLLSERARSIADARRQALEGAQSVTGQRTGLEAQGREELRGERGYVDTLKERARQNAIEQYQLGEGQFQQTLAQALASGDPSRALAALQSAAYGMGGPASAYGQQAESSGAGLQDLAELFINQFYGNQGAK